jgi:glycosyltransferase involved in cell wall biosynthesis
MVKPKLAFVSLWDARDPNIESGYGHSMRTQLQRRFEAVDVFPLGLPAAWRWQPLRAAYRAAGQYYHPMREPTVLTALARRVERALKAIRPDVVFSPSSVPMSHVETRIPWAYATDQLFCDFVESYIAYPARRFYRHGDAQERGALRRAAFATYPSDWAARSALARYGADAAKVAMIPWGANLPRPVDRGAVMTAIASRNLDRCHLVFLGSDWRRKGGEIFVATVQELNRIGVPTRATVIGCVPAGLPREAFTVHPYLDKRRADHFRIFAAALFDAHFLLLPSRAEAYGQALCEAAAYGVPSIGSRVGGIPTIVRDGETGFVYDPETKPATLAALIRDTLQSPARYRAMARAARDDHDERLNWDRFGDRLGEALGALA